MKTRNTSIQIILFLLFVCLASGAFFFFTGNSNNNQQHHLQLITERYQLAYNTVYDQYKQLAIAIHSEINKRFNIPGMYQQLLTADEAQKNRLREELLAQIMPRYEELQQQTKVRQLHFHLANNDSFLRFHRPEKFGDRLTAIRETVAYVNKEYLPIDGFEEGKIYNGYRFVFPITAPDQTHLGSVEISFGPEALSASMMKQHLVLSNFYIKETIVKRKVFPDEQDINYVKSCHQGYLCDKNVLEELKKTSPTQMNALKPQQSTLDAIYANAHSNRAMSFYDPSIDTVFTTIPVFNPVTQEMNAFFTIRSQSDMFINEKQHFRVAFLLSLLLLLLVLSTFYLQWSRKKTLETNARQLENQKQRLVEAQKTANLGHWEYDFTNNYSYWSDQLYCIFGLQPQQVVASYEAFLERVHPDDRNFVKTSHTDSVKNHRSYDIQHRLITMDGEEKWIREVWTIEYDEDGKALRSLGIVHDITEQHTTLTLLQQERDVFMNGPVMTFTWQNSENWPVEQISENVKDVLGYSAEEFLNGSVQYATCIHPDDLQRVIDEVESHSVPETSSFIHEPYRLITRNGRSVWFLDSTTLVRNRQGEITHYQGYLVDITKMVLMEKEVVATKQHLQQTQEMLIHNEKLAAIGKLSASIAHEFNNPLAGIQSVIEGIKINTAFDEQDQKMIDLALSECDRIKHLIRNLQDFNRPSSGLKQSVDIHALLDDMIVMVNKEFDQSHITIKREYAPALPKVEIVSDQIKQVILNLLTNAKDAIADDSGKVTISTEKLNDTIAVRIKDTGNGIAQDDLSDIFEPFFTTKSAVKGTGLGLSVSYGIIKGHRGEILVDSIPGKGTTFSVILPVNGETSE